MIMIMIRIRIRIMIMIMIRIRIRIRIRIMIRIRIWRFVWCFLVNSTYALLVVISSCLFDSGNTYKH